MEKTKEDVIDFNIILVFFKQLFSKYKWKLLIGNIFCAAFTVIIVMLLPFEYTTSVVIFPAFSDAEGGLASMFQMDKSSTFDFLPKSMLGGSSNNDKFLAILKSRTMQDFIIKKFNYFEYFKAEYIEHAREMLKEVIKIDTTEENFIIITVMDRNPEKAAQVANEYAIKLDELNNNYKSTGISRQKVFLENRLLGAEKNLKEAEEALLNFKINNKIVSVMDQAKVTVEAASQLENSRILNDIELSIAKSTYSQDQDSVLKLNLRKQEIEKQINKFHNNLNTNIGKSIFIPISGIPKTTLEYTRLERNLQIQNSVYELLIKQHEMTKIAAAKEMPSVEILDKATVPTFRSWPKRTRTAISAFFVYNIFIFGFTAFRFKKSFFASK